MYELLRAYAFDTGKSVDAIERMQPRLMASPFDGEAFAQALPHLEVIAETSIFLGYKQTAELATKLRRVLMTARKSGTALSAATGGEVANICAVIREQTVVIGQFGAEAIGLEIPQHRQPEAEAPATQAAKRGPARFIPLEDVVVGARLRQVNETKVAMLAESIAAIGLQTPISVAPGVDGRPVLVAGLHRMEAIRRLGLAAIEAVTVVLDDLNRELWQIDENLIRSELTQLERDQHVQRRRKIFEALAERGSETGRNSPGLGGRGRKGFAADTEAKTGVPKRRTNEALRRISSIAPDVQEAIKDLPLADVALELEALAALPADAQRRVVRIVRDGNTTSIRAAVAQSGPNRLERELRGLQRAWRLAGPIARKEFLNWLASDENMTGKAKDSTAA